MRFDERELLDRVDHDLSFLAEAVEMFETDARATLFQVRLAAQSNDAPTVGATAHTLKGMISNFCAPAVQSHALEVERAAKQGDCASALAALSRLEPDLELLLQELSAFIKSRSP
jgi:HPt (histidine-containing phosphotransfer) domain-containing protein